MSCFDCETPTQVKSVAGEIQCEETREGEVLVGEERLKRRAFLRS